MIQDLTMRTDEELKANLLDYNTIKRSISAELKAKLLDFNTIKSSLSQWDRKGTGSLNSRSLTEYVKKEDWIVGSLNSRSLTEYVKKEHFITSEKLVSIFCAV
ncbi:hypothetical protein T484DRAFT_1827842 [Baffinella frigidus]|nr:hypothetical protein T484DRAFT_1827842 [Cryptophyta sp. CCMP2293]